MPVVLALGSGEATLIDESYNANPASMRAALSVLGQMETGPRGRRIAVLGDMLELGPESASLHAALAEGILANRIDLVFCSGPLMHALWEALPPSGAAAMPMMPTISNRWSPVRSAPVTR